MERPWISIEETLPHEFEYPCEEEVAPPSVEAVPPQNTEDDLPW